MEALRAVSGTQLLFPAIAVAAVLICATLVFALGFRTPVEPAFDKSPLLQDDRKKDNKKRKPKDKKTSPNRSSGEDSKKGSDSSKKSPIKEKKEEKVKEPTKPKEKPVEPKPVKAEKKEVVETGKNKKKGKNIVDEEKPVDFDEGDWLEVPKKEKKKPKQEEKKESPAKKIKKKGKEVEEVKAEEEAPEEGINEVRVVEVEVGDVNDKDEVNRELRDKINELKLALKEAELRDNGGVQPPPAPTPVADIPDVPDKEEPKDRKKKEKKDRKKTEESENGNIAEKENIPEAVTDAEEKSPAVVFDELGDTWSDAKAPKKSKKKVRKE